MYRAGPTALAVDTTPLPVVHDPSACIALSGGGSKGPPRLEDWAVTYLEEAGYFGRPPLSVERLFVPDGERPYLWRPRHSVEDRPLVLIARARLNPLSEAGRGVNPVSAETAELHRRPGQDNAGRLWRDFRVTAAALKEVLAAAAANGRRYVLSPLLAAGSLRTVPAPVTLLAMLDAWTTAPVEGRPALTVHVVDEAVQIDLEARRIDAQRLLSAVGDGSGRLIPFWLELVTTTDTDPERVLVVSARDRPVLDVVAEHGITGGQWEITVEPVPCLGWAGWRLAEVVDWHDPGGKPLSFAGIGVLHGSTIRLREQRTHR